MSGLKFYLFGRMRVTGNAHASETRLTPIAQSILAYLLLHPVYTSRETLACLHWCEQPEDHARSALSTALWRLRRAVEDGQGGGDILLTAPTGDVSFNWQSGHWVDLIAYRRTAERILALPLEQLAPADAEQLALTVRLYTDDLLVGLDDDWVLYERERVRLLHLSCLRRLMDYMRHTGRLEDGLRYGLEIARIDPLNEEIHRALMRMYAWLGQRSHALRQYEQCRRALAEELDIEPMAETVALHRQIMAEGSGAALRNTPIVANGQPDLAAALAQVQQAIRLLADAQEQLARAVFLVECLAVPAMVDENVIET